MALADPSDAGVARYLRRKKRVRYDQWVTILLTLAVFLAVWEIVGRTTNPLFFAPISEVAVEFWIAITDPRMELLEGFVETLSVLLPGFIIASVLGIAVGILMGRNEVAYQLLEPFVTIFYNTPRVALIPILMLWLGIGLWMKITVVIIATVFPVIINTMIGIRDISGQLTEPARSFGASERQLLVKVVIPASLPFMIAGLKLGLGRALTTVVVAEFFVSISGLGGILYAASSTYQMAKMFVPALLLALMGILIDALLSVIERATYKRYGS